MGITLKVPKLAVSMQTGVLQEWLVADGATVTEGQPIYTIEAEKVVQEIEAPASGVLRQIAAKGGTYKVGELLGEIADAPLVAVPPTLAALGDVYHVGYVVESVEAAAEQWARMAGAGPFFLFKDFTFERPNYRGNAVGPKVTLAFGAAGDLAIELIQQHDAVASPYRERPAGFHHIGIFEKQVDARIAEYAARGVECFFRGSFAVGGQCGYLDTTKSLGCYLELVEEHPMLVGMINQIKTAHRKWDRRSAIASF
jgi:pyruvate/2-oxoglutarate dehydrogenase complex dihydrolipoamide acyltransferase (E2) component